MQRGARWAHSEKDVIEWWKQGRRFGEFKWYYTDTVCFVSSVLQNYKVMGGSRRVKVLMAVWNYVGIYHTVHENISKCVS